jgi:hypothetical protein
MGHSINITNGDGLLTIKAKNVEEKPSEVHYGRTLASVLTPDWGYGPLLDRAEEGIVKAAEQGQREAWVNVPLALGINKGVLEPVTDRLKKFGFKVEQQESFKDLHDPIGELIGVDSPNLKQQQITLKISW